MTTVEESKTIEDAMALPPFSFSKKPIDKSVSISTDLNITSSLFRESPSKSLNFNTKQGSKQGSNPGSNSGLHHGATQSTRTSNGTGNGMDIDVNDLHSSFGYDEHIRFPRMNSTFYTYNSNTKRSSYSSTEEDSKSRKNGKGTKSAGISRLNSFELAETSNEGGEEKYQPAAFDLTKTLRRLSKKQEEEEEEEEGGGVGGGERGKENKEEDDIKLILEYTKNNKLYNSISPQAKLKTSLTRMKKPLMTPAVLRPPMERNSSSTTNLLVAAYTTYTILNVANDQLRISEPTHEHWKPNSSTCMGCRARLFSSLVSIIYDVSSCHHCRLCGLVFCNNCLEETVVLDQYANLIVPLPNRVQTHTMKESRVCQKCTRMSQDVTKVISQHVSKDIDESFVIVENPYTAQLPNYQFIKRSRQINTCEDGELVSGDYNESRRQSVVGEVPSDWTWSSF